MRQRPFVLVIIVGALVLAEPAARGQEPVLGGFLVRSTAAGTRLVAVHSQSPTSVQGNAAEMSSPYALAELTTGPTGTALAGATFPGPLLSNLEGQGGPTYPGLARAQSPGGPSEARNDDVPGVISEAAAEGREVSASATGATAPPAPGVTVGRQQAVTRGTVEHGTARGESFMDVSDFALGDGVFAVRSIRSVATAEATPTSGRATASTTVTGMTIAGQPATVDESGIKLRNTPGLPVPRTDEVLEQLGIAAYVAAPTEQERPGAAEATAGGLIIVMEDLQRLGGPSSGSYTLIVGQAGAVAEATEALEFSSPAFSRSQVPPSSPSPPSLQPSVGRRIDPPHESRAATPSSASPSTGPLPNGLGVGLLAIAGASVTALAASAGLRRVFYETFRPESLPEEP